MQPGRTTVYYNTLYFSICFTHTVSKVLWLPGHDCVLCLLLASSMGCCSSDLCFLTASLIHLHQNYLQALPPHRKCNSLDPILDRIQYYTSQSRHGCISHEMSKTAALDSGPQGSALGFLFHVPVLTNLSHMENASYNRTKQKLELDLYPELQAQIPIFVLITCFNKCRKYRM